MTRVFAILLACALANATGACAKVMGKKEPPVEVDPPPPVPLTSATTPPIWHPPEPPSSPAAPASATVPAPNPDLVKARAAAEAKDFKKVKTLLEKKVRSGKGTAEEAQLVHHACAVLKDKACADAVKAKHPDDVSE